MSPESIASTPMKLPAQPMACGASDARALVGALEIELAGDRIDLPSFPDVALRVRKALTNDDVGIDDAVMIVSAEPALAARLMQLANSATLNPGGKRLTNLRTAMTRVGLNMACSVTIAFAISQLRRAEALKGIETRLGVMWQEAAHLAAVSRVMARCFSTLNADTALLAGLMQCVGKLYLLTRAARYPLLLADDSAFDRLVEQHHTMAARAILARWDMDREIVDTIGACEDRAREHNGAVDLADILVASASLIALGAELHENPVSFLAIPAVRRLRLDVGACSTALAESRDEIKAMRRALDA